MLLDIWGYEAHVAHDGERALALARDVAPEVVVADIGLPDMDGVELARTIRALVVGDPPFLIALTGRRAEEIARLGVFDHVLRKPVDIPALERVLHDRSPHRARVALNQLGSGPRWTSHAGPPADVSRTRPSVGSTEIWIVDPREDFSMTSRRRTHQAGPRIFQRCPGLGAVRRLGGDRQPAYGEDGLEMRRDALDERGDADVGLRVDRWQRLYGERQQRAH